MSNTNKKPRYVKTLIPLSQDTVPVYAGVRVANALRELTKDMSVYHGIKFVQVMEALYLQGKKDGAHEVYESFHHMMKGIRHLNPGKPKKRHKN